MGRKAPPKAEVFGALGARCRRHAETLAQQSPDPAHQEERSAGDRVNTTRPTAAAGQQHSWPALLTQEICPKHFELCQTHTRDYSAAFGAPLDAQESAQILEISA